VIKGSSQQEDIILVNIYAQNIGVHESIKEILTAIKGDIDRITIIVGEFNSALILMVKSSRQNH